MLIKLTNTINSIVRKGLSVIRNGLKMWLPFEKSGSDSSGNSNNATLYTGKALSFDGVNDYVDLDGFTLDGDTVTFAFWVNPDDIGYGNIIDFNPSRLIIGFNTNQISINSSGAWYNFGALTLSTWSRVVVNINGTTARCYVNGIQLGVDKTITAIDVVSATEVSIGARYSKDSAFFEGVLSDFQIYDTAWTQADVTFDYDNPQHLVTDNSDSTIALSNLKGYWHLSEGDGAINYDSSGEGNDGTINGATWDDQQATIPQLGLMDWAKSTPVADEITLISDPNDPSKDILGNSVRLREHSLNLDGSGYAEVPDADNLDFGTGDFSYGFWFKVESGDLGFLFGVSSLGNPSGVALTMDVATGKIRSRPFGIAATYTTSGYNDGSWHYAFHNIDRSDSAKLFIDNTEVLSQDISSESSTSLATTNWYVGVENGTGTFLNGLIDDVTIYNRALSADEVEQNYKAGLNKHKASSSFSDDFSSDYGF